MMAVVLSLSFGVVFLFTVWLTNRPEKAQSEAAIEVVELSGGVEDGAPDETLNIESPAEESADASVPDIPSEEREVAEAIDAIIELSDDASMQLPQQFEFAAQNTGKEGSATGTGRRALGLGPGQGGMPRHQRWFVRFPDRGTLNEYAAVLDHFGIELGLLVSTGELAYVSNLSSPNPTVRRAASGKGENRLYFTWQGGQRRGADLQLLQKAGLQADGGVIFHFYPAETEKMLAEAEVKYRNRPVKDIRRTYFTVSSSREGHTFEVANQAYY
ncbi:MAG: hypothetical protein AB7O26_10520 [Planctomycetaceae bacterium]